MLGAQLAHLGCPIVGDVKYGAPDITSHLPHHELALCATQVEFKLATKDEINVVSLNKSQWNF
jgi:23S rRNA-/tRNA-specific pseudouridylate synthase